MAGAPPTDPADDTVDASARRALRVPAIFVRFDPAALRATIPARFAAIVARAPSAIAVRCGKAQLDYATLDRLSDAAARRLLRLADAPAPARVPVALLADNGLPLVVWILAALKAGCAYAPLDTRLPAAALAAQVAKLGPRAIVAVPAYRSLASELAAADGDVAVVEASLDDRRDTASRLGAAIGPDAPACVFFTSGSTGAPKAVVDSHRNLMHNVLRYTDSLSFAPGDRLSVVQQPSFSGTISSLFGALLNGATAVLRAPDELSEPLGHWVRSERITVFHAVPAIFRQLAPDEGRYPDLRLVRLEGDRASADDVALFRSRCSARCVLVNGLGATECGLVRQYFVAADAPAVGAGALPIGYPVRDMAITVCGDDGAPLPPGAVGEIVVESRYVALGYWNDVAATAARFADRPDGRRRYRTGDLGRLDVDGCLTHLGRRDRQPKIGGRFVDTLALEAALLADPAVGQVLLHFDRDAGGEPRLLAYLVAPGERGDAAGRDDAALRARLRAAVPAGPWPARLIWIDRLPLSADGKVDPARLPPPDHTRPALAAAAIAPRDDHERHLLAAWSDVFDLGGLGIDDGFGALGGDSLAAARIVAWLAANPHPGLGAAAVTDLFEFPTVRALAAALARRGGSQPYGDVPTADLGCERRRADAGRRDAARDATGEPGAIAIVGLACRVPGADDAAAFWALLRDGREAIRRTPTTDGDRVVAHGALDDVEHFDAAHFGLTPRVAAALDPQQRLWLECVQHALEDAHHPSGRDPRRPRPRVGVFAGCRESTYLWDCIGGDRDAVERLLHQDSDDAQLLRLGNDADSLATRTAYLFDLTGPALTVRSACSTSLVAVAQACDALRAGHCELAIAGGVSVTFPQASAYRVEHGGIRSPDGRCRPFDAAANGTVFGDGAGVVVLKRLVDARADHDRIHAVIEGWAVNNDGAGKASFAAPGVGGQADVIVAAQRHAGVTPGEIDYVEAHGTGTPIGDPIEVQALVRAFGRDGGLPARRCALGSVKANIGHLDSAAGVVGLIKTVLALQHRLIPPTPNWAAPNPAIDFAAGPFFVADRPLAWPEHGGVRRAGVTSLGVGGTNCHLVVAAAPPPAALPGSSPPEQSPGSSPGAASPERSSPEQSPPVPALLTLSARSPAALDRVAAAFAARLETDMAVEHQAGTAIGSATVPSWPAFAAASRRSRGSEPWRLTVLAADRAGALARLRTPDRQVWRSTAAAVAAPRVGFVFGGQGCQYAGMAVALYRDDACFRAAIDRCAAALAAAGGPPLLDDLRRGGGGRWADDAALTETDVAQPVLFALGWSLARWLIGYGVQPACVLGHSLGELIAATVAGVFTLEDGLAFALARGRLMQTVAGRGGLRLVAAAPDEVARWLAADAAPLAIAACNAPRQTVVAGDPAALDDWMRRLAARGVAATPLPGRIAFHSAQLDPLLPALHDVLAARERRLPAIPLIGNREGRVVGAEVLDPAYWCRQAREPVRFADGVAALRATGCDVIVEIAPQPRLAGAIAASAAAAPAATGAAVPTVLPTLVRGDDDHGALRATLARLHTLGAAIDWRADPAVAAGPLADLPSFPFERRHYRYRPPATTVPAGTSLPGTPPAGVSLPGMPLLGMRLPLPGSREIRFATRLDRAAPVDLGDHRLFGVPVAPGALHFALLAQAAATLAPSRAVTLERLSLLRPLVFPDAAARDLQLVLTPESGGAHWSLSIRSIAAGADPWHDDAWTEHVVAAAEPAAFAAHGADGTPPAPPAVGGAVEADAAIGLDARATRLDLAAFRAGAGTPLTGSGFYRHLWANQGGTGASFRWLDTIWRRGDAALGRVVVPARLGPAVADGWQPGLFEAACQLLHACGTIETVATLEQERQTYVPFSVHRLWLAPWRDGIAVRWCHARRIRFDHDAAVGDLALLADDGRVLARIEGFALRRITDAAFGAVAPIGPQPASATGDGAAVAGHTTGGIGTHPAAGSGRSTAAEPDATREALDYLRRECAELSRLPIDAIDPDASFVTLGLDSLMAVMLANRVRRDRGGSLDAIAILRAESLRALVPLLTRQDRA